MKISKGDNSMMLPTKKITKGDVKKLAKIKNKSKKSRGQLKF